MQKHHNGKLIVVEGIDGTGKTTLVKNLAEKINLVLPTDRRVYTGFEPTKETRFGRKIRHIATSGEEKISPLEELGLFMADRAINVDKNIIPRLEAGDIVLLDRYMYSSMAYQGVGLSLSSQYHLSLNYSFLEDDVRWASIIGHMHTAFAPIPDLLIILRLDVDTALDRIKSKRGQDLDMFEQKDFLCRVSKTFDSLVHPNLHFIDASQSPEDILQQAYKLVEAVSLTEQKTVLGEVV